MAAPKEFPTITLQKALQLAAKIYRQYKENLTEIPLLVEIAGSTATFNDLCKYGLVEIPLANQACLTNLALNIILPAKPIVKHRSFQDAAENINIFTEIDKHFCRKALTVTDLNEFIAASGYNKTDTKVISEIFIKNQHYLKNADRQRPIGEEGHYPIENATKSPPQKKPSRTKTVKPLSPDSIKATMESPIHEETEWGKYTLRPDTKVRILATGPISSKEIGRLIKLLSIQHKIFVEDEAASVTT